MGLYILKLSACLLVFWALYVLLIEKQSTHQFKRFYLLGSLLVSAVIPLITFTTYIEPLPLLEAPQSFFIEPLQQADTMDLAPEPVITLNLMLWLVYGIGSMIFATRFSLNLSRLIHKIKTHEQVGFKPFIHVLLEQAVAPHSFFNYLFFSKTDYEAKHIPKEVHIHEEAHARQLHSLDILLIELLQIALWFNPLIYIIKHHIKLNHEFLADKAVLNHGVNTTNYQNILLDYLSHQQNLGLSSSINYSSIKKRIHVMTTKTSKQKIWMSGVLLLSITALLVYSLSSREQVENPKSTEDHASRYVPVQKQKAELYATEAQMSEYNNFMSAYKQTRLIIEDHYERAVVIYDKLMSDEQRDSVEKYPTRLIPQPNLSRTKPIKPTAAQFEDFKNGDKYAIWLDGEVIPNTELNNYSLSDIVHVTGSKIHNNASSQRFPQPFQYHLYTKNGFKTIYQDAQLRKYNETSKRYTDALRLFLNGPREDNSELLIQYEQTRNLYETFSAKDKAQYSIKPPPPPPAEKNTQKQHKVETGFIELKKQTLYFTKINGKLTYYNRQGFKTDKTGKALEPKVQTKANAVLPNTYISKVYKGDLVVSEFAPVDDKQDSPIYYQDGIGKKELAAYNTWAKTLNKKAVGGRIVKLKDYEYYFDIYSKMSERQKDTAEPFPAIPPPPVPHDGYLENYNTWAGKLGQEIQKAENDKDYPYPIIKRSEIEKYRNIYDNILSDEQLKQALPFPKLAPPPKAVSIEVTDTPLPPPRPMEHVKELASEGAIFYYEGNKVSSKQVIDIISKDENHYIKIKETNSEIPLVYLSKEPFNKKYLNDGNANDTTKNYKGGPSPGNYDDLHYSSGLRNSYLKKFKTYETLRYSKPHFVQKTKAEQQRMRALWIELRQLYIYKLSKAEQKGLQLPIAPVAPYVSIKLDGKTYYKLKNNLTKEEQKTLISSSSLNTSTGLDLIDSDAPITVPIGTYKLEKSIPEKSTVRQVFIRISEDGNYAISKDNTLKSFEILTLNSLETLLSQMSQKDIQNTFVFAASKDYKQFRSKPSKSPEYQDDIEVILIKDDIRFPVIEANGLYNELISYQSVLDNAPSEALKRHTQTLAELFKKYGITNLNL